MMDIILTSFQSIPRGRYLHLYKTSDSADEERWNYYLSNEKKNRYFGCYSEDTMTGEILEFKLTIREHLEFMLLRAAGDLSVLEHTRRALPPETEDEEPLQEPPDPQLSH